MKRHNIISILLAMTMIISNIITPISSIMVYADEAIEEGEDITEDKPAGEEDDGALEDEFEDLVPEIVDTEKDESERLDIGDYPFTTMDVDGGVQITGPKGIGYKDLVIPGRIGNKKVVSFRTNAFENASQISRDKVLSGNLTLANTIEEVGYSAFHTNLIKKINVDDKNRSNLPTGISSIGPYSFSGNTLEGELVIGPNIKTIEYATFSDHIDQKLGHISESKGLDKVTFTSGDIRILSNEHGIGAFIGNNIKEVNLLPGMYIGDNTFGVGMTRNGEPDKGVNPIERIVYPGNVTIGTTAFNEIASWYYEDVNKTDSFYMDRKGSSSSDSKNYPSPSGNRPGIQGRKFSPYVEMGENVVTAGTHPALGSAAKKIETDQLVIYAKDFEDTVIPTSKVVGFKSLLDSGKLKAVKAKNKLRFADVKKQVTSESGASSGTNNKIEVHTDEELTFKTTIKVNELEKFRGTGVKNEYKKKRGIDIELVDVVPEKFDVVTGSLKVTQKNKENTPLNASINSDGNILVERLGRDEFNGQGSEIELEFKGKFNRDAIGPSNFPYDASTNSKANVYSIKDNVVSTTVDEEIASNNIDIKVNTTLVDTDTKYDLAGEEITIDSMKEVLDLIVTKEASMYHAYKDRLYQIDETGIDVSGSGLNKKYSRTKTIGFDNNDFVFKYDDITDTLTGPGKSGYGDYIIRHVVEEKVGPSGNEQIIERDLIEPFSIREKVEAKVNLKPAIIGGYTAVANQNEIITVEDGKTMVVTFKYTGTGNATETENDLVKPYNIKHLEGREPIVGFDDYSGKGYMGSTLTVKPLYSSNNLTLTNGPTQNITIKEDNNKVEFKYTSTSSIEGTIFIDKNEDGIYTSPSDPKYSGSGQIDVKLLNESGTQVGNTLAVTNGDFKFDNVDSGKYRVEVVNKAKKAYRFTSKNTGANGSAINVDSAKTDLIDFKAIDGDHKLFAGLIEPRDGMFKFKDAKATDKHKISINGTDISLDAKNGKFFSEDLVKDAFVDNKVLVKPVGNYRHTGWEMTVRASNGDKVGSESQITSSNFDDLKIPTLEIGQYIQFEAVLELSNKPGDGGSGQNGKPLPPVGENDRVSINGTIFIDEDADGVYDGSKDKIYKGNKVEVKLIDENPNFFLRQFTKKGTVTDGKFSFKDLRDGEYNIEITNKDANNYHFVDKYVGSDSGVVSDAEEEDGSNTKAVIANIKVKVDGGVVVGTPEVAKTEVGIGLLTSKNVTFKFKDDKISKTNKIKVDSEEVLPGSPGKELAGFFSKESLMDNLKTRVSVVPTGKYMHTAWEVTLLDKNGDKKILEDKYKKIDSENFDSYELPVLLDGESLVFEALMAIGNDETYVGPSQTPAKPVKPKDSTPGKPEGINLDGTVFIDNDGNGKYEDIKGDELYNGTDLKLELFRIDDSGNSIGNPIETITSINGSFTFDNFKDGKFKIQITNNAADKYHFTKYTKTENNDIGSDAKEIQTFRHGNREIANIIVGTDGSIDPSKVGIGLVRNSKIEFKLKDGTDISNKILVDGVAGNKEIGGFFSNDLLVDNLGTKVEIKPGTTAKKFIHTRWEVSLKGSARQLEESEKTIEAKDFDGYRIPKLLEGESLVFTAVLKETPKDVDNQATNGKPSPYGEYVKVFKADGSEIHRSSKFVIEAGKYNVKYDDADKAELDAKKYLLDDMNYKEVELTEASIRPTEIIFNLVEKNDEVGKSNYKVRHVDMDGNDLILPYILTERDGIELSIKHTDLGKGYTLVSTSPVQIETGVDREVVFKFNVEDNAGLPEIDPKYRVREYKISHIDIADGSPMDNASKDYNGHALEGTKFTVKSEEFFIYQLVDITEKEKELIISKDSDNEVIFEYEKLIIEVTVRYVDENDNTITTDTDTNVFVGDIVSKDYRNLQGYILKDYKTKTVTVNEDNLENIITFKYKKASKLNSEMGDYRIRHVYEDANTNEYVDIVKPIVLDSKIGSKVVVEERSFGRDYIFKESKPSDNTIVIKRELQDIVFVYEPEDENNIVDAPEIDDSEFMDYTVEFLDEGTNLEVKPRVTLKGYRKTKVTVSADPIYGYKLSDLEDETKIIDLSIGEDSVKFMYESTGEDPGPGIDPGPGTDPGPEEPEEKPKPEKEIDLGKIEKEIEVLEDKQEKEEDVGQKEKDKLQKDLDDAEDLIDELKGGKKKDDLLKKHKELQERLDEIKIREKEEGKLNRVDHFQYIEGYKDGTIRPTANITREEASAIIFRVLDEDYRDTIRRDTHDFKDVSKTRWSAKHIGTLEKGKLIEGYKDGTFRATKNITRAEVATIVSRFAEGDITGSHKFTDVKGHWAEDYIGYARSQGWLQGYKDGSFKPNEYITRAEFVTIINNVLERQTSLENMLPGRTEYKDLVKGKWYYEAMQEAINGHEYIKDEDTGVESWTELKEFDIEM